MYSHVVSRTGWNKERNWNSVLFEKHCCSVGADTHCIHCPEKYHCTSWPRWSPCQHYWKSSEERVGAALETRSLLNSQELLSEVEPSAYFQIHCHFLHWLKHQKHLIWSTAWRALFSRDWLNKSAEPARRPCPIRGSGQAYEPGGWREGSSKGMDINVQKLHYRKIWYNNENRSGPVYSL